MSRIIFFLKIWLKGLVPGKKIIVNGQANGDQFAINLKGSQGTLLHLNPRMQQNAFVRNSCIRGVWGNEERSGPNPFRKHQPFEMIILVENDRYKWIKYLNIKI